jgi:hypothetical protein
MSDTLTAQQPSTAVEPASNGVVNAADAKEFAQAKAVFKMGKTFDQHRTYEAYLKAASPSVSLAIDDLGMAILSLDHNRIESAKAALPPAIAEVAEHAWENAFASVGVVVTHP